MIGFGRSGNFRIAVAAIRAAKWRSLLTMLGIIIGVVSVVTTVSLGEGARRGVVDQIHQSGEDLVTIRPGRSGSASAGLFGSPNPGSLQENDLHSVRAVDSVQQVVPFAYVSGTASREDAKFEGVVIGTTQELPDVLGQEVLHGGFFQDDEPQKNAAVIGQRVAEELFGENVPIGKYLTVRGKQFIVRGIFEEFTTNPLTTHVDYNTAIFIPYETGKQVTGSSEIYQILAKAANKESAGVLAADIKQALGAARSGQTDDFVVLRQQDKLTEANETLTMMTGFVASIAAISLIVGGIGILNIMLVAVTERTHEIGIRKALGATNRQILSQFLTEAVILSVVGGIIGILLALVTNYLFRIFTDLTPVLTWPIVVVAFGVSVAVGIVFGVTPAATAARKRPIDALRYE